MIDIIREGTHYYYNGEYIGRIRNKTTESVVFIRCKVRRCWFWWEIYNHVEYEVCFRAGSWLNGWFSGVETEEECGTFFLSKYKAMRLCVKRNKSRVFDIYD